MTIEMLLAMAMLNISISRKRAMNNANMTRKQQRRGALEKRVAKSRAKRKRNKK